MGVAWFCRLSAAVALLLVVGSTRAAAPLPPLPESAKAAAVENPEVSPPQTTPNAIAIEATTANTEAKLPADPATLRAQTLERLDALSKLDKKSTTPATMALVKLLEQRRARLDEWDKAVNDRRAVENPSPSPEKQVADWKAELERVSGLLEKGAHAPDLLLPSSLRSEGSAAKTSEAVRAELKEAIDNARAELKDWSSKLEKLSSDPLLKEGAVLGPIRSSRDKAYKRLTLLKSRNPEREAKLADAKNSEAREVARETIINYECEAKAAEQSLGLEEARLALETRRVEVAPIYRQLLEAHSRLARATLDRLKSRYQNLAENQERELRENAGRQEVLAKLSNDPLQRYRAKRAAELLDEEARVVRGANMLATEPPPSLEEQRRLADRAFEDFTGVKHLLDDGEVSHLDALRLTNDFRRIGVERSGIIANELAASSSRLTLAENALSTVELELMYDRRDDRYELDGLLERLPKERHAEAIALFEELEKKHFLLLNQRRDALDKLAARAQQTHDEVLRHLKVLDEHFGFIRTHIFWVRDEEPISVTTLVQANRELIQLGRASLPMASELLDKPSWERVSVEFIVSSIGLVVLPWPLYRTRRALRSHWGRSQP